MDAEIFPGTLEGCEALIRTLRDELRLKGEELTRVMRDLDIATNMIVKAREALAPTPINPEGV